MTAIELEAYGKAGVIAEASPHFQAIYDARVAAFLVWNIISEVKNICFTVG